MPQSSVFVSGGGSSSSSPSVATGESNSRNEYIIPASSSG